MNKIKGNSWDGCDWNNSILQRLQRRLFAALKIISLNRHIKTFGTVELFWEIFDGFEPLVIAVYLATWKGTPREGGRGSRRENISVRILKGLRVQPEFLYPVPEDQEMNWEDVKRIPREGGKRFYKRKNFSKRIKDLRAQPELHQAFD